MDGRVRAVLTAGPGSVLAEQPGALLWAERLSRFILRRTL